MSNTFLQKESISENVHRIYTEFLDKCIYELTHSHGRSHSAVHETRKNFKKMRALFRLVKGEIGKGTYKAYNSFFRNEARKISELRDVNALIETLDELKKNYQEE